jgi:aspartate aminotransferase-like enzyme
MGAFKDQMLRIAHLGHCNPSDIEQVLDTLREALACVGVAQGRAI